MKGSYNNAAAQLFSAVAADITSDKKLEFGRVRVDMKKAFLLRGRTSPGTGHQRAFQDRKTISEPAY